MDVDVPMGNAAPVPNLKLLGILVYHMSRKSSIHRHLALSVGWSTWGTCEGQAKGRPQEQSTGGTWQAEGVGDIRTGVIHPVQPYGIGRSRGLSQRLSSDQQLHGEASQFFLGKSKRSRQ